MASTSQRIKLFAKVGLSSFDFAGVNIDTLLVVSKAQDSDIVATSSIMSLKCPLSTLRIDVPCRSTICSHNQCFDALSFLQLQEQAPTWTCPVCNKVVTFEGLEVDEYALS